MSLQLKKSLNLRHGRKFDFGRFKSILFEIEIFIAVSAAIATQTMVTHPIFTFYRTRLLEKFVPVAIAFLVTFEKLI